MKVRNVIIKKTSMGHKARVKRQITQINRGVTIVDTIDLSRLLQARYSIVDSYFALSILSPIVETAIDFFR